MKKVILLIAIGLISYTNYAQNSIFDKFEDMDEVTTVVVNQDLFKMLGKIKSSGEDGEEYLDLVKGLTSLKVFTTENSEIAKNMTEVVSKYLKSTKLTELMRVKDKDANVKIYIKQGKDDDHVSELLMFANDLQNKGDQEAVILSLTGDIDLNNISKITEAHIPNSGLEVKKQ